MKTPTEQEIIEEVEQLKKDMKTEDFQMGIGGFTEKEWFNRINKILRMLKNPVRRIKLDLGKGSKIIKRTNGASVVRRKGRKPSGVRK